MNIVHRMYEKDGISRDEVVSIVNRFPNQGTSIFLMDSIVKKKRTKNLNMHDLTYLFYLFFIFF